MRARIFFLYIYASKHARCIYTKPIPTTHNRKLNGFLCIFSILSCLRFDVADGVIVAAATRWWFSIYIVSSASSAFVVAPFAQSAKWALPSNQQLVWILAFRQSEASTFSVSCPPICGLPSEVWLCEMLWLPSLIFYACRLHAFACVYR